MFTRTTREVAQGADVSTVSIGRWAHAGLLKSLRLANGSLLFQDGAIDEARRLKAARVRRKAA